MSIEQKIFEKWRGPQLSFPLSLLFCFAAHAGTGTLDPRYLWAEKNVSVCWAEPKGIHHTNLVNDPAWKSGALKLKSFPAYFRGRVKTVIEHEFKETILQSKDLWSIENHSKCR